MVPPVWKAGTRCREDIRRVPASGPNVLFFFGFFLTLFGEIVLDLQKNCTGGTDVLNTLWAALLRSNLCFHLTPFCASKPEEREVETLKPKMVRKKPCLIAKSLDGGLVRGLGCFLTILAYLAMGRV